MAIEKLLIANRGEIALRIHRACHEMGIKTVAVHSTADTDAMHVRLADEAVCIGPPAAKDSYLNIPAIISAAEITGADAIHPGYGFLSENERFAEIIEAHDMIFVGPKPEHIRTMGDKVEAKRTAVALGLPVVPGSPGAVTFNDETKRLARDIGYPVLIKAASGGGGRGMKRVDKPEDLKSQIGLAMSEAEAAFGDPRIYVERFIASGRHVEVQVIGDGKRAIHLGTRDCSIQRRFQKLVEEAPAPNIPDDKHRAIENAAVKIAEHLHYKGAGTVEFLVDAETFDFYFLEMNARIQVEHPVTEEVTGVDIVEQQLLIASGAALGYEQRDIGFLGAAIEVRINAEDPDADFRPSPGLVQKAEWPAGEGVRVDTHIRSGDSIPPTYDSLMGKLIVHGATREEAIARTAAALATLNVEGVKTTAPLHARIMDDARFQKGGVDTRFFEGLKHG